MAFEQTIFHLLASVGVGVFITHGITRWRCKQSNKAEDVALTAISSLFSATPTTLSRGEVELRPIWAIRLLVPLVALLILAVTDFTPLWMWLGIRSSALQFGLYVGMSMGLGGIGFMMLFVQRVVYDTHNITCHGIDLRLHTRSLNDLVGIDAHSRRTGLVLTFDGQKDLIVPKSLSHSDVLMRDIAEIVANNTNNGMVHPLPRWQTARQA